jgi:peptidoglycan hydrolase CwlO-like protein
MKNTILVLAVTAFMGGTMVAGCNSSDKKVENARDKVQDAKENMVEVTQELNQALKDSIQQFKNESVVKISHYEKSIAEFKARIANEKKENKAIYEKKLAELEQKNSDMKKKLEDFKDEGQGDWRSFKSEFNHDMDELGQALKDLTVDNNK